MSLSIRGRMALAMIAASVMTGLAVGVPSTLLVVTQVRSDALERARIIGDSVEPMAIEALLLPDDAGAQLALDGRLGALRRDPGVRRIAVVDVQGERVPRTDEGEAPDVRGTGEQQVVHDESVLIARPILVKDTPIGYLALELVYPRATILLHAAAIGGLTLVTMLVAGVLALLVSAPATADVRRIHRAIERLGRGETWLKEDLREGGDEFGRVGAAIRDLATRLEFAAAERAVPDEMIDDNPEDAGIEPTFAPVHVAPLVAAVASVAEIALPPHRVLSLDVQLPDEFEIVADAELLHAILRELLDNATRHADGPIAISVFTDSGGGLRVVVQDTGPGLDDRAVRYLFRPVPGAGREGRFGVGLATAHRHARLLGGELEVDHRYRRGMRVILRLPYRRRDAA